MGAHQDHFLPKRRVLPFDLAHHIVRPFPGFFEPDLKGKGRGELLEDSGRRGQCLFIHNRRRHGQRRSQQGLQVLESPGVARTGHVVLLSRWRINPPEDLRVQTGRIHPVGLFDFAATRGFPGDQHGPDGALFRGETGLSPPRTIAPHRLRRKAGRRSVADHGDLSMEIAIPVVIVTAIRCRNSITQVYRLTFRHAFR